MRELDGPEKESRLSATEPIGAPLSLIFQHCARTELAWYYLARLGLLLIGEYRDCVLDRRNKHNALLNSAEAEPNAQEGSEGTETSWRKSAIRHFSNLVETMTVGLIGRGRRVASV